METRLVERAGVPFVSIPAAGIHGVSMKSLPGNVLRLVHGFFAARQVLKSFNPDVLFFTGGYVAVPLALAGMRFPTLLYVPDVEPALALKTLANFADKIALTMQESYKYFRHTDRLVLTGYPTRPGLEEWTPSAARQKFELSSEFPVLLVIGGSKGARSINRAIWENLPQLLEKTQLLHITGELDWPEVERRQEEISPAQAARYHAFPYLHEEMGAALAAADLALSRAGASTLGEYPLFGLPAILVPYPYAWRYQKENASVLVNQGAAIVLEDEKLNGQLLPTLDDLLSHPQKLASMRAAMRQISKPQAATEIGRLLFTLAQERS